MKKILCVLVVVCLVMSLTLIGFAESSGTKSKMNRYNVVFVTDASNSMNGTDPEKLRYEAIDLFVSLSANGGNYIGSVVFSDEVLFSNELTELKSKNEKKAFIDGLRNQKNKLYTNIGLGLKTAVDMLENGGNKDIPSIIILLTDGITEMETEQQTADSVSMKEDAMEDARNKGIKIFTISLNKNDYADTGEMKQIASATGGEFREVTSALDLQSVFDVYYQLIYSTQSIKLVDEQVPENGLISRDFSVVDLGVEEVNVVIFGDVTSCSLIKPSKNTVSGSELDEMLYNGKSYTLIKIPNPDSGLWNLSVNAAPGSTIKIFKIYNSNLDMEAEIVNESDSYQKDVPIDFLARIIENNTVITDTSRYSDYKATLTVTYLGETVYTQTSDTAGADGFKMSFTPSDYGTYYASVLINSEELSNEPRMFTMNVGNHAPTVVTEVIKKHVDIWPFLISTDSTVNLDGAAVDDEDSTLTYKVKSSSWMEEDYELKGSELTINNFSVSKGSFEIEAYDSLGAFCTFKVEITSTNIGIIAAILLFAGILIAVAAIIFAAWRLSQKPFMGSFEVENLAPPHECTTRQKSRGQLKVNTLQIGPTGLDKDAHFQATGKNYVIFKSKKPVYNDYTGTKSKSFRISSSTDVRISPTNDYEKGIRVRFESMLNNNF